MANPQPTLAGFIVFVRTVMGINSTIVPDDSDTLKIALAVAMSIVNRTLRKVPIPSQDAAGVTLNSGGYSQYSRAVYNLAADNLINYGVDLPDAPVVDGSGDPGMPFFAWTRKQFNTNGFVSGVVSSTGDEGTNVSLVVQKAAEEFTLANLQNLKTPYGRTYLAIAQSYGPSTWGMS